MTKTPVLFCSLILGAAPVFAQAPKPAEEVIDLQARKRAELRETLRMQMKPQAQPAAQRELTPREREELRELLRQQRQQGKRK
jgi:hypothetical protein